MYVTRKETSITEAGTEVYQVLENQSMTTIGLECADLVVDATGRTIAVVPCGEVLSQFDEVEPPVDSSSDAFSRGIAKLMALGLTEEEASAIALG